MQFTVSEIAVRTTSTLKFANLNALRPLGVDVKTYAQVLYRRTQEIGDAAAFLGFDGIIAPNARWDCDNLVLFCDQLKPEDLTLLDSSVIDFDAWRRKHGIWPSAIAGFFGAPWHVMLLVGARYSQGTCCGRITRS